MCSNFIVIDVVESSPLLEVTWGRERILYWMENLTRWAAVAVIIDNGIHVDTDARLIATLIAVTYPGVPCCVG